MKVKEIREDCELQNLRPVWDLLLRNSASANTFLSWEWIASWWLAYGKPGTLRILTALDDAGEVRGIAPLYAKEVRRYKQTVESLLFIGDGSNDSDYLDFLIAQGYEQPVLAAFHQHWNRGFSRGVALLLNEFPATSPNVPILKDLARSRHHLWRQTETPCGTISLPESWDAYLTMLRPRFRTKIRSVLRNLEGRDEVSFGFCRSQTDLEQLLPILFDLHTRRWQQEGKPGVFGWLQKQEFYRAVSPLLLERNWLRLSWLKWGDQVIACQYGFVYGTVYYQLQEGYEPDAEHYNPGIGLRGWSIREFLKEGIREYDSMGGFGRHKSDWGASVKQSTHIVESRTTIRHLLLADGLEWERRAKDLLRQILPDNIVKMRRLGRGHETTPSRQSSRRLLRNIAATCYFHSGLPTLIRPLREHYQFTAPVGPIRTGRLWRRRIEPTARILYYHRVNDDNDPFFPAMPTGLFEREMRYIAQHYKVVSLSELQQHLTAGGPEPVLAVTFDDGYQDNYQNAFPVLQRYGLPATIFLTTGSIDTREPLWFEELALAIKTSTLEHLDVELKLPRRLWLRTQAERLDANSQLVQFLRGVSDSERRHRVKDLIRVLATRRHEERHGKMLTWDEIRNMKMYGIEFGGHTVTHPFISKLTPDQALLEVSECKQRIETELHCPVDYFAYPNGREEDFAGWSADVLRRAGYRAALTTVWGVNYPSTDPMEMRRGQPWEEDPAIFAYKLDWYELVSA
jgi:peptidoglycan/xylan/chitin deacetylase (PgdA/CDA1 family)/CelD/BcsL family acetyltransferase involved in cellulose biosynthesis